MKKFLSLLFVLVFGFFLVGCSSESYEEAYNLEEDVEIVEEVKIEDLKTLAAAAEEEFNTAMEFSMTFKMEYQGEGMEMEINAKGETLDKFQMVAKMKMNMGGQNVDSVSYFKDKHYYVSVEAAGTTMKYKLGLEDLGLTEEDFTHPMGTGSDSGVAEIYTMLDELVEELEEQGADQIFEFGKDKKGNIVIQGEEEGNKVRAVFDKGMLVYFELNSASEGNMKMEFNLGKAKLDFSEFKEDEYFAMPDMPW